MAESRVATGRCWGGSRTGCAGSASDSQHPNAWFGPSSIAAEAGQGHSEEERCSCAGRPCRHQRCWGQRGRGSVEAWCKTLDPNDSGGAGSGEARHGMLSHKSGGGGRSKRKGSPPKAAAPIARRRAGRYAVNARGCHSSRGPRDTGPLHVLRRGAGCQQAYDCKAKVCLLAVPRVCARQR